MKKENKQFWNAMWIITKKDVLPWLVILGLVTGGSIYMKKNKDNINKQLKIYNTNNQNLLKKTAMSEIEFNKVR